MPGRTSPADLTWQAELLAPRGRRGAGRPHRSSGTPPPLAAIRDGADLPLPDRLSMFGHTRLPVTELELLRAVGEVREVHLWLPQASPAAWDRIAADAAAAVGGGPVRRTRTPRAGPWRTRC